MPDRSRLCPTISAAVLLDPDGSGAMILDLRRGRWLHLNATATAFWRYVVAGSTEEQAFTLLARQHGVPISQIADDMHPLIDVLIRRRLLERVP